MRHHTNERMLENGDVIAEELPWTREDYLAEIAIIEAEQTPGLLSLYLAGNEVATTVMHAIATRVAVLRGEMDLINV